MLGVTIVVGIIFVMQVAMAYWFTNVVTVICAIVTGCCFVFDVVMLIRER